MYNFRKPIKMCLRKSVSRQLNNNAIQSLCKQGKLKEQTMAGKLRVLIWRELNSTESKSPATNCCFVYNKLCVFFVQVVCLCSLSYYPLKCVFIDFFGLFLYPPHLTTTTTQKRTSWKHTITVHLIYCIHYLNTYHLSNVHGFKWKAIKKRVHDV